METQRIMHWNAFSIVLRHWRKKLNIFGILHTDPKIILELKHLKVVPSCCWKYQVFWDVTLCLPLNRVWRFRGSSFLHLNGLVFDVLILKMTVIGFSETYHSSRRKRFVSPGDFNLSATWTPNRKLFCTKFQNDARYVIDTSNNKHSLHSVLTSCPPGRPAYSQIYLENDYDDKNLPKERKLRYGICTLVLRRSSTNLWNNALVRS
jgi:hypothetical protein